MGQLNHWALVHNNEVSLYRWVCTNIILWVRTATSEFTNGMSISGVFTFCRLTGVRVKYVNEIDIKLITSVHPLQKLDGAVSVWCDDIFGSYSSWYQAMYKHLLNDIVNSLMIATPGPPRLVFKMRPFFIQDWA